MIITIDGVDGVGKKTTIEALKERLEKDGEYVYMMDFPQYDKPGGMAVRQYLTDPNLVSAYRDPINMIYQNDRNLFMMGAEKDAKLAHATVILYNRSWISNMIFQTAAHPVEKNALIDDERIYSAYTFNRTEYIAYHILHAFYREIKPWAIPIAGVGQRVPFTDTKNIFNFILKADRSIIDKNIKKRGDSAEHVKDLNEKDLNFLDSVDENIDFISAHMEMIFNDITRIVHNIIRMDCPGILFEKYAFMSAPEVKEALEQDLKDIRRFFEIYPIIVNDTNGNQYPTNEIVDMIEDAMVNIYNS